MEAQVERSDALAGGARSGRGGGVGLRGAIRVSCAHLLPEEEDLWICGTLSIAIEWSWYWV